MVKWLETSDGSFLNIQKIDYFIICANEEDKLFSVKAYIGEKSFAISHSIRLEFAKEELIKILKDISL